MDTEGVELVKVALQPLCGALHRVFSASVIDADRVRATHGLSDAIYNSLGADLTRGLAHRALSQAVEEDAWSVIGRHHLRGQLMLASGMTRLRFLHDPRAAVPPPGRNRARMAYYRNLPFGQVSAFDAESSNLVAVWSVVDPELATVRFRIVRPISDKARWQASETEVDLDFMLPDTAPELEALEFEQYDEGLTIEFPDDIPANEEGTAEGDVG